MTLINYECIDCHSQTGLEQFFPSAEEKALQPMQMCCPFCGHACASIEWLEQHRNEAGTLDMRAFYERWSSCPNAHICSLHGQYAGNCEEGRMMPKCLVAVHAGLEYAVHFAREAAQSKPHSPVRKKQGKKAPDV